MVPEVRHLLRSLGELPEPVAEPALIIISGLPGTGKSYLSKRLAERVPFLVIESDALRKTLFSPPSYSFRESTRLFRTIHRLLRELLNKGIPLILVRVEAPPEVVYQRLEGRARDTENKSDADWAVYRRMRPSVDRIRRNHYVVDTSRDITPVLDKIVREVMRR